MALVDKYANFNLSMLMAILLVLSKEQLGLVLRFAEFLAKEQRG
ncbi:hypothetical protein ES705_49724 [subsurface metagenome]|jgi:hypothetical protein